MSDLHNKWNKDFVHLKKNLKFNKIKVKNDRMIKKKTVKKKVKLKFKLTRQMRKILKSLCTSFNLLVIGGVHMIKGMLMIEEQNKVFVSRFKKRIVHFVPNICSL